MCLEPFFKESGGELGISTQHHLIAASSSSSAPHRLLRLLALTSTFVASFSGCFPLLLRIPTPYPLGPLQSNEDQYLDIHSPFESSEFQSNADTVTMENNPNVVIIDGEANVAAHDTTAGVEQAQAANCEEQDPFTKKKRKKTSVTWEHFREILFCDDYVFETLDLVFLIGTWMFMLKY
ncbi:hypothetical protein E3N88_26841 [Mikania micrantha]|uniref:Uncharacterized protein n=1 Tax=Mikania micrantha TaxID=192012 RepID=A0A5N6MW26_9ASTR|nr:hypothetical protein E3N88_26841 [Mikania micrantha]